MMAAGHPRAAPAGAGGPESPGQTLYAGDLLALGDEVFSPQATTVETAGGMVTAIHLDYMP